MILVFGETGQVATELKTFEEVKSLGRDQVNLSNPQACLDAILSYKPQAVINAAAYTKVDEAESEDEQIYLINDEAPSAMAMACAELNIPLVHISTDYVFDGTGIIPWRVSDTPNPKNAYGRSKLEGEESIKATGCNYVILRTSWIISAHGSNFVKTMLQLSQIKDSLNVVDDQVGGPTCGRDIAHTCVSIAKALIQDPNKSGVYHYSGMPDVSWCQFANVIFEQAGRQTIAHPISTSAYPTAALRPCNSRLDCTAIQDVFGIPRPYWIDGLKYILEDLGVEYEKA